MLGLALGGARVLAAIRSIRLTRVCVLLSVLLGAHAVAARQAPPCDPTIIPSTGHLGYRLRDKPSRCEGLYSSRIDGGLELVSLVQGVVRFEVLAGAVLRVFPPSGIQRSSEVIRVRAIALPLGTYYRLDGFASQKAPLNWPVGQVLVEARLRANQIGVFGWIERSSGKVFVPVRVVAAGEPVSGAPAVLTIRAGEDVDNIQWRSHASGGRLEWTQAAASIPAGRSISVELPDGPETVLTVEFTAKRRGIDRWSTLTIPVLRPKRP